MTAFIFIHLSVNSNPFCHVYFFACCAYNKHMHFLSKILDILFLFLFSLFMWINDPIAFNFTGLLNQSSTKHIAIIICMYWIILLFLHLYHLITNKKKLTPLSILVILTALTPYNAAGDIASQFHLFFALAAFLYLHYLLYAFYWYRQKATMFYIACLAMSGCFVLTYSSITGLSEWIFIIGLMSSLSYLDHSNMK